jgi:hypothetical protein
MPMSPTDVMLCYYCSYTRPIHKIDINITPNVHIFENVMIQPSITDQIAAELFVWILTNTEVSVSHAAIDAAKIMKWSKSHKVLSSLMRG